MDQTPGVEAETDGNNMRQSLISSTTPAGQSGLRAFFHKRTHVIAAVVLVGMIVVATAAGVSASRSKASDSSK
jgi:hypothetical protein